MIFAGVAGADDGAVVVDQGDDLDAGGSADAEVQEASGVAEANFAVAVDGVVADAPDVRVVGFAFGISW